MDTIFSLIGGAYKLLIDVPIFGIGIGVGAFGYNYLLKKNPAMLQKIVTTVVADAQALAAKATAKVATVAAITPAAAAPTDGSTPAQ